MTFTSFCLAVLLLAAGGRAAAAIKVWNGSVSRYWNTAANWTPSGVPVNGDDLVFPLVASDPIKINDITNLRVSSLSMNQGQDDHILQGNSITITNGITANSLSGNTVWINFAIQLGADQIFNHTPAGFGVLEVGGDINNNGHLLTMLGPAYTSLSGVLSGSGGLTLNGQVALNSANTYSGLTTVNGGIVVADNPSAFGSSAAGTVLNGGRFIVEGVTVANESLTNNSGLSVFVGVGTAGWGGNIMLNAGLEVFAHADNSMNLSGAISGTGDLTKTGSGTLTLSGANANTYVGQTFVDEGWLQLGKVGQVSIPGPVTIGSGPPERLSARLRYLAGASFAVAGGFTVNEASLLDLNGQSESFSLPGVPLTLNDGGDVQTGAGLLTLKAGSTVVVNPGTVGSSSITGRLGLDASLALGDNQTFNVGSGGAGIPLIISASMEATTARAANVVKTGPGEMWLNGANTFAGSLSVNDGRVTLGSSTAAGAAGGGVFVNNGGVLAMAASIGINGDPLTLNSTSPVPFTVVSGISDWDSTITLNRDTTINISSGASLGIYYGFAGSGRMTKIGDGLLQLRGSVGTTDTNTMTVAAGTLILDTTPSVQAIIGPLIIGDGIGGPDADVVRLLRNYQIGNNVSVTINSSGLLDLNGVSDGFRALSGSGHLELNGGLIAVNYPDATSTFDGVISGAGFFYKEGSGTLTLNGNNTLTGTTVLYADINVGYLGGTLLVNGSQPQSPVAISNGCTLGGSGVVGDITTPTGGTISPGASAGILTCGSVTLNSLTTFRVELNGATPGTGHDQLNCRGTVALGSATLNVSLGAFAPLAGQPLVILNNDGTDAISGTFGGLANGALVNAGGLSFRINYNGGSGNDVTLTLTNPPLGIVGMTVSSGNGNGVLDPNECNLLSVVLTNATGSTISGIQATLTSETPGVSVTQPFLNYAAVPAGSRRTNTLPFQLSTAPQFDRTTPVALTLHLQTASHGAFALPVVLVNTNLVGAALRTDNNSTASIPDSGSLNRTFVVSGVTSAISRVEISFYLTHASDDDLDIHLIGPDGTRVMLTTDNGLSGNNYGSGCSDASRTRFSDLAPTSITTSFAPFVGVFRPEVSLGSFANKIGAGVNGTWTLEIVDDSFTFSSAGTFNCASLFIYPVGDTQPGTGLCELCPATTISSVVGTGSPTHIGGVITNGAASACGTPKNCPGVLGTGPVAYEAHTFQGGLADACITATLTAAPGATLAGVVYSNSFNPANLCLNYLADAGATANPLYPVQTCSFNVRSNQTFVVVVSGSGAYSLAMSGGDCRPRLNALPAAGNNLVLDWTTAAPGYLLEVTNRIPSVPTPWPGLTNIPAVVNGRYQVTNSLSGSNQFHRLRRP